MNQPGGTDWSAFTDQNVGLLVRSPLRTPTGARVKREFRAEPSWRLHLTAPDGAVDVELMLLANLTPADEFARHRSYLLQRFGPEAVSGLTSDTRHGRPALTYGYRWPAGERRVLDVPVDTDTWRIIIDPRAPLNDEIVATVTLGQ